MIKYSLVRRLLFLLPPEKAHYFAMNTFRWLRRASLTSLVVGKKVIDNGKSTTSILGLVFKNKIGLAAGFDKNAKYLEELEMMGFGHVEIGTVTPRPQAGNNSPRLFRLPKDNALINRMGFNNDGVEKIIQRLKVNKTSLIIGGNIGKNKTTPLEKAHEDYLYCFTQLFDYVDYFVVNVSSPNTPQLRQLQEKEPLFALLKLLAQHNLQHTKPKPLLLKIAPDLSEKALDDILEVCTDVGIDGLVVSNTTIARELPNTHKDIVEQIGTGGVSGQPVFKKSNEVLRYIRKKESTLPIIAAGGIMSVEDAAEKIQLGADLVQVYTGLIYKGSILIKELAKKI